MSKFKIKHAPIQDNSIARRCRKLQEETVLFCEELVRPNLPEISVMGKISEGLIQNLRDTGWFGLMIDKKYGGMGLDCLHRIINVQYLSRECPSLGAVLQIAQLGTASILEFASNEQKCCWLPQMASGERICTISITESDSGSHILGMTTNYQKTAGGYLLNGEKCYIGNCKIANLHVVYAKEKDGKNIAGFIVPGELTGVDNSVSHEQMGLRAFPFGKLKLNNVFVPKTHVLGDINAGLSMAYYAIGYHGRPSLTALALGIHHRILDLSYSFAQQRKLYGKPIAELPDIRDKVFEIYTRFEQSRQLAYEAAERMSIGKNPFRSLALAKFIAGDHVCKAANVATEIFGARAGLPEFEIAQLSLDALMTRPPSGTGDVQKKRIMDDLMNVRKNPVNKKMIKSVV